MNENIGYSPESVARERSQEVESTFARKASKHLNAWDAKKNKLREEADPDTFRAEEDELLAIEKVRTMAINELASNEFIGKQPIETATDTEIVAHWGELVQYIENCIHKDDGNINILVTGLPISGKATIRRLLAKSLSSLHNPKDVANIDRDYIKMPKAAFQKINIVEDIHGVDVKHPNSEDLWRYNLVVYISPTEAGHVDSIKSRGQHWIAENSAKVDLTDGTGSVGASQLERMTQAAGSMARAQNSRSQILAEDTSALDELKESGVPVITLNPALIIEKAYPKS